MRIQLLLAASLPLFAMRCAESSPGPSLEPVAAAAAPASRVDLGREPVDCTIKGPPTCELGRTPKITVTLTNQTDADMFLVGSLDASDRKWRYPHCFFEVTGPDGTPAVHDRGRCGLTNPLRVKDFVKVPPGGSFDPYQKIDDYGYFSTNQLDPDTLRQPGVYRIRFVYSTKSDDIRAWIGNAGPTVAANQEIVKRFKQVPKVEVRSNEFVLTVVAPRK